MIPEANITEWRENAPWITDEQVEQDLIISRALVELFSDSHLSNQLAFRGGTALHKLFFNPPARYSEDIDLVRTTTGPIKEIIDCIRNRLDSWLGAPTTTQNQGRFTLKYTFVSEVPAATKLKVKIEINTREHKALFGVNTKNYSINNPWFSDSAAIRTYFLEELLGTKLRAIYQRKKGRDLFDLGLALITFPQLDTDKIIASFDFYLASEGNKITRAQFEENFYRKINDVAFSGDIAPLLSNGEFNVEYASKQIYVKLISKINGRPWKGLDELLATLNLSREEMI